MIKYLKLVTIVVLMVACNSNKKKTSKANSENKVVSVSTTSTSEEEKIQENKSKTIDQETLKSESISRGKLVYQDMCVTCHLPNGKGVSKAFPPVADSDFLRNKQNESIRGVKKGMSGKIVVNGITYNSVMSPLGLSDKEVADVMNYINNSWGNDIDNFVTVDKVSKL